MRKLGLLFLGSLVLSITWASAALAHPADDKLKICRDNILERGIYPPSNPISANKGKFDLSFTSGIPGDRAHPSPTAVSTITGGAIVCGNHVDPPWSETASIFLPTASKLTARCANSASVDSECKGQRSAGYADLGDTWHVGNAEISALCKGPTCFFDTITDNAYQKVDYNTKDPWLLGDTGPNRCTSVVLNCTEDRSVFLGIDCNGDVTYERPGSNPYSSTLALKIYEIHCQDLTNDKQYIMAVQNLVICAWANTSGSGPCGTRPDAATGTNLNGIAGTWTWNLEVYWTDGSKDTATSQFTWGT